VAFTGPVQVKESHYGMAALAFLVKSFGGLLIGIFFGLLSALATRTTQHHRSESFRSAPKIKKATAAHAHIFSKIQRNFSI